MQPIVLSFIPRQVCNCGFVLWHAGIRGVQVLLHGLWSRQTCGAAAISKGTVAVSKGAAAIHIGSAAGSRREAKVGMKQNTGSVP